MLRFAFLSALWGIGSPIAAQETEEAEQEATKRETHSRADQHNRLPDALPRLRRSGPSDARYFGDKEFAVPEAAKRAGHNGSVKYRVTVSAQGKPTDFELIKGSGSGLLDHAALKHIEQGRFAPAYDADRRPVEGTEDVFLRYSRWKSTEPGEGLANYTCARLTAEYDWWQELGAEVKPKLFLLQNMYTSAPTLLSIQAGRVVGYRERAKIRKTMDKEFLRIVKTCRNKPETLFVSHIDRSDEFISMLSIM